ncbi:MAG: hypothetical protein NVS3B10_01440 [Polyangiales bacterium]
MVLRRALLPIVLLLASILAGVGCGPRWTVIRQGVGNPFTYQRTFAVEAVHFEGMHVGDKTESEYQAGKDTDQQRSWQADKQGMIAAYQQGLVDQARGLTFTGIPPAPGTWVIRPIVTFVEPGFYAGIAAGDTVVNMIVQVVAPDGQQVVDEIQIASRRAASMTSPSSGGRMRSAAEDLGSVSGKYLLHRLGLD